MLNKGNEKFNQILILLKVSLRSICPKAAEIIDLYLFA